MRHLTFALVAAILTQCLNAGALSAEEITILAKAGATIESRKADKATCSEVVARAPSNDYPQEQNHMTIPPGAAGAGGVPGVAGAAIVGLIFGLIELGRSEDRAESLCMRNLGYAEIPLSTEEAAAFKKLPPREKVNWEREFLSSDLSVRVHSVLAPKVPRLPAYRDEPMSQGGLKILRESLSLSGETVEENLVVVTGKAVRSRTAILTTPIETSEGSVRIAAEPGSVFHQVDYRTQTEPLLRIDGATWCGQVRQLTGSIGAKDLFCFTGYDDGYRVYRPSGQPWMAGPYTNGFVLPNYTKEIHLEEREVDDLGPLDLEIVVEALHRNSLDLTASVGHGGKRVRVLSRNIRFDKNAEAVLPLWDLRLIFTSDPKGHVTARLSEDGTGQGWRDGR